MSKPWRWTKFRKAVRTLLEGGKTVDEIERMLIVSYKTKNPDARPSEAAATLASLSREVKAVAERVNA
jgi:hypothetical protein